MYVSNEKRVNSMAHNDPRSITVQRENNTLKYVQFSKMIYSTNDAVRERCLVRNPRCSSAMKG